LRRVTPQLVSSPVYFVRIGAEVRGPCSLAELRALAEAAAITPETEAAPSVDGPWSLMITLPERAAIFPVRIALATKPGFTPTSDSPTPIQLSEVIAASTTSGPVLRTRRELEAEVYRAPPVAPRAEDVQAMVRGVQEREAAFAPPPRPAPKRKISRRLKFVLALAVSGNAALVAIPVTYGALHDEWAMLIFRGWFLIYNGGLVILYFALPKE
jgi:hypothetical protein